MNVILTGLSIADGIMEYRHMALFFNLPLAPSKRVYSSFCLSNCNRILHYSRTNSMHSEVNASNYSKLCIKNWPHLCYLFHLIYILLVRITAVILTGGLWLNICCKEYTKYTHNSNAPCIVSEYNISLIEKLVRRCQSSSCEIRRVKLFIAD